MPVVGCDVGVMSRAGSEMRKGIAARGERTKHGEDHESEAKGKGGLGQAGGVGGGIQAKGCDPQEHVNGLRRDDPMFEPGIGSANLAHKDLEWWAIDSGNSYTWAGGLEYVYRTSARICLPQKCKVPQVNPIAVAGQPARSDAIGGCCLLGRLALWTHLCSYLCWR